MNEMTPRQRWLAILSGRRPDRVVTDYWRTDEFDVRLRSALGCKSDSELLARLHIDRPHHVDLPFGPAPVCTRPPRNGADMWGVRYVEVDYGTGRYRETAQSPLADARTVADVEAHAWPKAEDLDYAPVLASLDAIDQTRLVRMGAYEPFLRACQLRGLERAYMDLALEPKIMEAILAHIFEFHYEHTQKLLELAAGRAHLFYLAEDLGGQAGPLMSLETYRRFLRPNQIRMAELVRAPGLKIFYHTDGAARIFLPDLIDVVGVDVLNPVQWRCAGMEREALARDFGGRVLFHGAMDNQQTLPFGSRQDVIDEVKRNLEIFGPDRWICAPCHNIQAITPPENVIAMYETIHQLGRL